MIGMARRALTRCLCAAVLIAAAGCYKHVIRAEGFGENSVTTYEPNAPGGPGPVETLEGAVWLDKPKSKSWRDRSSSWK